MEEATDTDAPVDALDCGQVPEKRITKLASAIGVFDLVWEHEVWMPDDVRRGLLASKNEYIDAGTAIYLTVMSINLLGAGLRDALDPYLRNR